MNFNDLTKKIPKTYTTIPLNKYEEIIQCNDCGATVIANKHNQFSGNNVKHYNNCIPIDPEFYSLKGDG